MSVSFSRLIFFSRAVGGRAASFQRSASAADWGKGGAETQKKVARPGVRLIRWMMISSSYMWVGSWAFYLAREPIKLTTFPICPFFLRKTFPPSF
jgi:hypothetical protein